jgi:hypothetical protein
MEDDYADNHVLRALVQAFPFGSSYDAVVAGRVADMRAKRARAFFDRLAKNEHVVLTPEMVENEDFLHAYTAVSLAVVRTRRKEKIELLADMLSGYADRRTGVGVDEYEELMRTVDELSYREILVLTKFYRVEIDVSRQSSETGESWRGRCRPIIKSYMIGELGIPGMEVWPILKRLEAKGLLNRVVFDESTYLVEGEVDHTFAQTESTYNFVTDTFVRVRDLVEAGQGSVQVALCASNGTSSPRHSRVTDDEADPQNRKFRAPSQHMQSASDEEVQKIIDGIKAVEAPQKPPEWGAAEW